MLCKDTTFFNVTKLNEIFEMDIERVDLAKKRQAAFFAGKKTDKPPIVIYSKLTQEQEEILPDSNFKEIFFEKDKMLQKEIRFALGAANSRSDIVPSIRANLGCGVLCSCLGLEQEAYEDKYPWMKSHLNREQVADLSKDDILIRGTFARGIEFIKFYQEIMGNKINYFHMDNQGPFDLAHLIMGDDIFLTIYDDPDLVHHLLDICTELSIKSIKLIKELLDEPFNSHYHSNYFYAENMGLRICEDTTAIVGPDVINEFAIPYSEKVAKEFGGAWIHYCGRNDALTEAICESPYFKAMNFGMVPGKEHNQPFEEIMEKCRASNTRYVGDWHKRQGETDHDFLKRIHEWAAEGILLPVFYEGTLLGSFESEEAVLDYWYSL